MTKILKPLILIVSGLIIFRLFFNKQSKMAAGVIAPLIASILARPEIVQRRIASLVGAIVADAASQHLQWIYDQGGLNNTVGDSNPEFWAENKCAFFNLPNGKLSCYGDETLTTLEAATDNQNTYDESKQFDAMFKRFRDPESPYQISLAKRPEKKYPIDGPWLNGGLIRCFENRDKGISPTGCPDNHDADGFCLGLPFVIQKSDEDFETGSKHVVQILTTNEATLAHNHVQAKLIQSFINGDENPISKLKLDMESLYPDIVAEIEEVEKAVESGQSVQEMVKKFGLSCSLPGSFHSALVTLIKSGTYVEAVRENMKAGGDCCSRAIFIGACLGAKDGIKGIPTEWLEKVENIDDILTRAEKLMS